MCIFLGQKSVIEKGLLAFEQFPLPLPKDELGGDVILGWREWAICSFRLKSPVRSTYWDPAQPLYAQGKPSQRTGRGIYCFDSRKECGRFSSYFQNVSGYAAGRVALFGSVLNFDGSWPVGGMRPGWRGAMGEYAYPLDLHVRRDYEAAALLKTWGKMGVNIWLETPLGKPVLYK